MEEFAGIDFLMVAITFNAMSAHPAHPAKPKAIVKPAGAPKIDAKQAVSIAAASFRDLFPEAAEARMMLEEIEESADGGRWLVTLGYDILARRGLTFDFSSLDRAYKTVAIDNATGKVISIKIRSVA